MPVRGRVRKENSESRPGRPMGDHEAKRAELLEAAIAVIADLGYGEASLRKVAQRAGYTTGAVTYYFANKEEMVAAVADCLFDEFDRLLAEPAESRDQRKALERWLEWVTGNTVSVRALFQLNAQARHEPAFVDTFQRRYGQYRDRLAAILAKDQKRGEVRDDIPADLLADQLCAIGDGWMMAIPIERKRFTPKRIQTLLDSTITLIAPPSRSKR